MIEAKSSFLKDLAPETYCTLSDWKGLALIYSAVLLLFFLLSLFLQWSFIKFFIDILMGWTLLSLPFMGVIIVSLDKEVKVQVPEYSWEKEEIKKSKHYKYSKIWGITLCVLGCTALYFSGKYKDYYAFQCQTFYLDENAGMYHILNDCDYIYDSEEMDYYEIRGNHKHLSEIKGIEILDSSFELCDACREWAEDASGDLSNYYYRR